MLRLNKHFYLFAFYIVYFININAQNLILNHSFEEYINFDTAKYQGWHKAQKSDTPDYFNLSNDKPYNNIFNKFIGGINPKTGNGFVGIFCYRVCPNRNIKNIREFIETPVISQLEKDSLYRIQISLCLDVESNIAIKNFGIFFSPTLLQFNKDFKLFDYKPQIEFNSTFLDSTRSWITLYTIYKAKGFEKYMIIGNFKPDKQTLTKKINTSKEKKKKKKWDLDADELASYYYIDDVIVEKKLSPKSITIVNTQIKEEIIDTFTISEIIDTFNISEIKLETDIILKNIVFDFNKTDLLPQSYTEINKLFYLMISYPTIRIKLEGHSDNIGSYDFNLQLSLKRVESVVSYLIKKGISPDRIEFEGYSYSNPLTTNNTEEGRQINRRVTFKIIEK